jgi:hypothetical protein
MFVNRRAFLAAGAAAAGALVATPAAEQKPAGQAKPGIPPPPKNDPKGRRKIFRLSLRGRRGSQFAKRYNANMRFATKEVADRNRAHKGDHSRVVPLTVSIEEYQRLFVKPHTQIVDLRKLGKNTKFRRPHYK